MSAPTATPTMPIAGIKLDPAVNPRIEVDADALAELAASIKEHGVLQPIVVRPGGELVAGARRLAAAKKAGLKEIPVHVADLNGGALAAAITENVVREDLTAVEEAQAFDALQKQEKLSLRDLGRRVGKSKDYVANRLRLLALPEPVRAHISAGDVGLHAIPNLVKIAEHAPRACEIVVELALDESGDYDRTALEDVDPLGELLGIASEDPAAGIVLSHYGYRYKFEQLPLVEDEAVRKQLGERFRALPAMPRYTYSAPETLRFEFDPDDVDAARAFGCLIELKDNYGVAYAIADRAFITSRVELQLAEAEKKAKTIAKGPGKPASAASSGAGDGKAKAAEEKRRAEARKEREAEQRKRVELRGHNLELGRKLATAFKKPKITADVMRTIAEIALAGRLDTAYRGLRYVDERLQTVENQKNGAQKITYADSQKAAAVLRADLDRAKTAEEIAGVVLKAFAAAEYASQDVVAQSSRSWWAAPYGASVRKLIDKVAGKHVPAKLKKGRR